MYASMVLWPITSKVEAKNLLRSLQGSYLRADVWSIKTTPTEALEVSVCWTPLDLSVNETARTVYLSCYFQTVNSLFSHSLHVTETTGTTKNTIDMKTHRSSCKVPITIAHLLTKNQTGWYSKNPQHKISQKFVQLKLYNARKGTDRQTYKQAGMHAWQNKGLFLQLFCKWT